MQLWFGIFNTKISAVHKLLLFYRQCTIKKVGELKWFMILITTHNPQLYIIHKGYKNPHSSNPISNLLVWCSGASEIYNLILFNIEKRGHVIYLCSKVFPRPCSLDHCQYSCPCSERSSSILELSSLHPKSSWKLKLTSFVLLNISISFQISNVQIHKSVCTLGFLVYSFKYWLFLKESDC